jgi:hypothetical protein
MTSNTVQAVQNHDAANRRRHRISLNFLTAPRI